MKAKRRFIGILAIGLIAILLLYWLLLCFPQMSFRWSLRADNLELFSDKPFDPLIGEHVLEQVQTKLAQSPLYVHGQRHRVFVCNARWRQKLFFNYKYKVGGVNYYPFTTNIFLREAIIEENCLIGPSGKRVSDGRTLDYFIVHEITHTLTGQAVGALAYYRSPQWVREGYADYVAKEPAFNYAEARAAFLADVREMDWSKSGLYWRYHLLTAFLLERQHWSVQRLLQSPMDQQTVEDLVRAERTP